MDFNCDARNLGSYSVVERQLTVLKTLYIYGTAIIVITELYASK